MSREPHDKKRNVYRIMCLYGGVVFQNSWAETDPSEWLWGDASEEVTG